MSASTAAGESLSTMLGGSASNIKIHKTGLGLMLLTWTPNPVPDEQSFPAIKAAIDLVPANERLLINSAEFYGGQEHFTANLELLARFFTKYPELADRTFLSVKGGTSGTEIHVVDGSPENLRRSVDAINKALDGKKRLDLFECARVDPKIPIEQVMESLKGLIKEGKFDHIGVSEISAETLKKAAAVAPIASVEIEVSPWSYEEETKKVIATARDLKIPVVAYSPLGRGFLTGQLKKEDLPAGDMRLRFSRFQDEALAHNQKIVDALSAIAQKKGVTNAQLSLAWVSNLGPHMVPIPGSSKVNRVQENFAGGNIKLTEEEVESIKAAVEDVGVKGGRYFDMSKEQEHRWG
ncbi:hypothetical protein M407DRAFT_244126 [Tulasnella calospora MUT 4182]|uniref:NADP-dependent oxidoreductase domain-containing protein n=1 Tax=Tulasnella calospora MUT 4182 TaxID=1051891 RepID=A0A0C3LV31_9AGAM|nr:hypothetical protein M407DRAFT_244126 [Tulasnella calospora MUT 4182]